MTSLSLSYPQKEKKKKIKMGYTSVIKGKIVCFIFKPNFWKRDKVLDLHVIIKVLVRIKPNLKSSFFDVEKSSVKVLKMMIL